MVEVDGSPAAIVLPNVKEIDCSSIAALSADTIAAPNWVIESKLKSELRTTVLFVVSDGGSTGISSSVPRSTIGPLLSSTLMKWPGSSLVV